jgi:hypothetical protein
MLEIELTTVFERSIRSDIEDIATEAGLIRTYSKGYYNGEGSYQYIIQTELNQLCLNLNIRKPVEIDGWTYCKKKQYGKSVRVFSRPIW